MRYTPSLSQHYFNHRLIPPTEFFVALRSLSSHYAFRPLSTYPTRATSQHYTTATIASHRVFRLSFNL
ncbi:hypothetical protein V2G26_016769 [Clonostachys chloroleuca]